MRKAYYQSYLHRLLEIYDSLKDSSSQGFSDVYLTAKQTADILHVSVKTVYQYSWLGILPKHRPFPKGGRVYFKLVDVAKFMIDRVEGGQDE